MEVKEQEVIEQVVEAEEIKDAPKLSETFTVIVAKPEVIGE